MFNRLIAAFAIFGTMACGYLEGSPWAILFGAITIAALRSEVHFDLADKHAALGRVRAWALFAGASIGGRAVPCALAFAAGRTVTLVA